MSDLVEFLRARLDEDEAVARTAAREMPGAWRAYATTAGAGESLAGIDVVSVEGADEQLVVSQVAEVDEDFGPIRMRFEEFTHIARHDPARVMREVEAKRRIVDLSWHHLGGDDYGWGMEEAKRQVLCIMAAIYSDHPDYREEWR